MSCSGFADLTDCFNWNVKQLFVYLQAEYRTPDKVSFFIVASIHSRLFVVGRLCTRLCFGTPSFDKKKTQSSQYTSRFGFCCRVVCLWYCCFPGILIQSCAVCVQDTKYTLADLTNQLRYAVLLTLLLFACVLSCIVCLLIDRFLFVASRSGKTVNVTVRWDSMPIVGLLKPGLRSFQILYSHPHFLVRWWVFVDIAHVQDASLVSLTVTVIDIALSLWWA